jgi:hypothetical protein
MQSYTGLIIARVVGFGVTPLSRPLIDDLLVALAYSAKARTLETSRMSFVTFFMSSPLQRSVDV